MLRRGARRRPPHLAALGLRRRVLDSFTPRQGARQPRQRVPRAADIAFGAVQITLAGAPAPRALGPRHRPAGRAARSGARPV